MVDVGRAGKCCDFPSQPRHDEGHGSHIDVIVLPASAFVSKKFSSSFRVTKTNFILTSAR
jgi:hypothetical protein